MAILLYLYKLRIPLPKDSTDLYHHFICFTICQHLAKLSKPLENFTDLTHLFEPYNRIIQKLPKLSLEALNKSKMVFIFKEIKTAHPDIAATPEAISGFGLIQVVQHFVLYMKIITLNFIYFTI